MKEKVIEKESTQFKSVTHQLIDVQPYKCNMRSRKRTACYLCRITLNPPHNILKVTTACIQCNRYFHVNCFHYYHFQNELSTRYPHVIYIIKKSEYIHDHKNAGKANHVAHSIPDDIDCPFMIEMGNANKPKEKITINRG